MRLLVAIGGTEESKRTTQFAYQLARLFGAEVAVLHVAAPGAEAEADEILQGARAQMQDLKVELRQATGNPAQEIINEAGRGDYDLVIVGAREKGTLAEQIPGSVARSVLSHATIPVLVVRGDPKSVKRILVCTGAKPYAEPAVRQGVKLAKALDVPLTLLHVSMSPPTMYSGLSGIDENLAELLRTDTPEANHLRWASSIVEEEGVKGELLLRHGAVAEEILREIVVEDYGLVILGAPLRRGPLTEYLMGDVAGKILSRAETPVLIVRRKANGNGQPPHQRRGGEEQAG